MQHIENKLFILDIPLAGEKCHSVPARKKQETQTRCARRDA